MKRKLPPIQSTLYVGPDGAQQALLNANEYHLWATAVDSSQVVRVVRRATHEVPNSKWVEFAVVPEAMMMHGAPLYVDPMYNGLLIRCEWSDFLRLTRWRKAVQGRAPHEQAQIAALQQSGESEYPVRLVAIDHPIRRGLRT